MSDDLDFDRVYRLLRHHYGDVSATAAALDSTPPETDAAVRRLGLSQLAKRLRDYHEHGARNPPAVDVVGDKGTPGDELPPGRRRAPGSAPPRRDRRRR